MKIDERITKVSELFEEDIYQAIDLMNCVNSRKVPGGPASEVVRKRIEERNLRNMN